MTIYNFVTQDELDDLSEDPRVAFMELVNHAQRRYSDQSAEIDTSEGWHRLEELQQSFMNVIVAAAKKYEIEPFVTMDVPRVSDFQNSDYKQFKADLDHYLTQLIIDNSIRAKHDSVAILPNTKDSIRKYVQALRECIEKGSMSDAKREALLKKLSQFEVELEKRRLSLLAVTRFALELYALPGAVWQSEELTVKLIHNVMHTVAEAKAVEQDTRQLPSAEAPKALSPPRKQITTPPIDDDSIPF